MQLIVILTIIVIITIPILYFCKNDDDKREDSCPKTIIDSSSIQPCDLNSPQGQVLLKNYMSQHFHEYLLKTKDDWNYVTPKQFAEMDKSNIFILDVRKPDDYAKGHITDSTNIFWLELMQPQNLSKLPRDREIVVVCYVGHTASQILVLLKLLGYKAKVLKFGMGISPQKGVPVAG